MTLTFDFDTLFDYIHKTHTRCLTKERNSERKIFDERKSSKNQNHKECVNKCCSGNWKKVILQKRTQSVLYNNR